MCPHKAAPQNPRQARAQEPTVFTVASRTCRRTSSPCVASPQVVSKGSAARSGVAPVAHVASGSHVVSLDVASTDSAGIARCDVKTGRHSPAWRQGARWRRQMSRRQNVASLAHAASGSQMTSQDVASKRRATDPRSAKGLWRRHLASGGIARCGVQTCGIREPGGVAGGGVAGRGVRTCRQAPSTDVASLDVASIRGVRPPRPPARVFKLCPQSSGNMCTPTGDPPEFVC